MAAKTLYDKVWDAHVVNEQDDGTVLLYIDRHLVHEVTSPQAFEGLQIAGRKPWRIGSMLAVADHNVPTEGRDQGIADPVSRLQVESTCLWYRYVRSRARYGNPDATAEKGQEHVGQC